MTTVQNKNGDYLKITANSHFASNNVQMEVPAQNREGRILVPLRFVSESLGYDTYFEPNSFSFMPKTIRLIRLYWSRRIFKQRAKLLLLYL